MNNLSLLRANQRTICNPHAEAEDYLVAPESLRGTHVIREGMMHLIHRTGLRLLRGYRFIRDVNYFWVKRRYSLRSSVSMAWGTTYW